jgi:hypothetical protein
MNKHLEYFKRLTTLMLMRLIGSYQLHTTRTIWVSCLSHLSRHPAKRDRRGFLPRQGGISSRSLSRKAGLLNFCSCTQDKFVIAVAPRHAHLPAIKILYPRRSPTARSGQSLTLASLRSGQARTAKSAPPSSLRFVGARHTLLAPHDVRSAQSGSAT